MAGSIVTYRGLDKIVETARRHAVGTEEEVEWLVDLVRFLVGLRKTEPRWYGPNYREPPEDAFITTAGTIASLRRQADVLVQLAIAGRI